MRQCAACAREIPEWARICEHCGAQVQVEEEAAATLEADLSPVESLDEPVVASPIPSPAPDPAPTQAGVAPVATTVGRRELLTFLVVAAAAGLATLAFLVVRQAAPSKVAAATHATAASRSSAETAASPAAAGWTTEHQAQWLGNRPHSAAFELPADNTVSIWLGKIRPILVVRCVAKRTETFVFTGSAIRIEPRTEDHTVRFAFDGGGEVSERWPDSAEHDALFAPDGGAFAERVAHAQTMTFGYAPHNAAPVVAKFHVAGLARFLEPAAKECGRAAR